MEYEKVYILASAFLVNVVGTVSLSSVNLRAAHINRSVQASSFNEFVIFSTVN
jgi:hypothetical protein